MLGKDFLIQILQCCSNQPFYFNNGMFNNLINIKITEYDANTLWLDSNNDQPEGYVLCLSFELME